MTKKRSRNNFDIGHALDLMISGRASTVVGRDFILKSRDSDNAEIGHLNPEALRAYDQKFIDSLISLKAKNLIHVPESLKDMYQEYREQREALCDYHYSSQKNVFACDIVAAKELGNFDQYISKVVLRNEAEINIFVDYIALYRELKGKRAIVQWNLDQPNLITNKNKCVALAYEKAQFSVLRLDKNLDHGAIQVTNIFSKNQCILMDKALNESRKEGLFFICSLLDMGKYVMTSGGGIPLDAASSAGKSALTLLKKHLVKLRKSKGDFNADVAECAREVYGFCLRGGALAGMTVK